MAAIEIEGLSFAYPGCRSVLESVDLSVEEGSFAVLCGATGSGKTTLLKCIKREIAPVGAQTGRILVFGRDVSGQTRTEDVGFVFQVPDAQIVCDSVWRELAFGLECQGMPQQQMERRLSEVAAQFGMSSIMDSKTSELSGGEKQRLNLASIAAMRPRILLLDEPTAQLDPMSARLLLEHLHRLKTQEGVTILLSTHDPALLEPYADVFIRLSDGSISSLGPSGMEGPSVDGGIMPDCEDCEAASRLRTVEQDAPQADGRRSQSGPDISVREAFFSYGNEGPGILRGLSMEVHRGEVVSLVGVNGSGKTTLLKIVAGILEASRGEVDNRLRSNQVFLPQDPRLLFVCNSVAQEAVELMPADGMDPEEAKGVLRMFGLHGMLSRSPLDLSSGQQQNLALAKLLLLHPQLLLLDEPAKGMDAASQLQAALAVRQAASDGAAVVIATHNLPFASRVSDRMAYLANGRIMAMAPPWEFKASGYFDIPSGGLFARMFDEACPDIASRWPAAGEGGVQ